MWRFCFMVGSLAMEFKDVAVLAAFDP